MSEPTIGAGYAVGLLAFATGAGADRNLLIEQAGIHERALEDHFNRVPLSRYIALVRPAAGMCDDPEFALHFGLSSNCADLSIIAMIGSACETVLEALEQLNRYGRLAVDVGGMDGDAHYRLDHDRTGVWLVDNRQHHGLCPELNIATLVRMASNIQKGFSATYVRELRFSCAPIGNAAEYEAQLGVRVRFERERSAILLDPAWMSQRIGRAPRYTFGVLTAHADALMRDLEQSRTTRGRVDAALLPMLHTGEVSMDRVAQQLAMSRATLYRSLKAEGATFEQVLDGVRHRMALHHLAQPRATVNQASHLLGFTDPAAFSRAFKRWTGHSPRASLQAAAG